MIRRTFLSMALMGAAGLAIGGLALPAFAQDAKTAPEITEMSEGAADAPLTVIEYASFTCPHCAEFYKTAFKGIKRDYIDTGKVRFVYREVYFDRPGLWASMVARCGGQEKFFGIAGMLYDSQREWIKGDDGAAVVANLRRIGRTAGISETQLDTCLGDGEKAQALVNWYEANAKADGITGTPSFVIDGKTYSNMSEKEFSDLLDSKLPKS